MDEFLPADAAALRLRIQEFVATDVAPVARAYDWDDPIPDDIMSALQQRVRELDLWLLDVPKEFGGQGATLLQRCIVEEELSKEIILGFGQNELFGPNVGPILYQSNTDQQQRFLLPVLRGELRLCFAQTEPGAGSDPRSMGSRAVRDGDAYLLNGRKRFIGNAHRADFAQVICLTEDDNGDDQFCCLMVPMDAPGVTIVKRWPTIAGTAPSEISFENVRVPAADRIGETGAGFALAQSWLTLGRIKVHGARSLGIAQRALDMAIDYANQRKTFGDLLANRQAVQFMIADSATELWAARLMVYQAAQLADAGQDIRDQSFMVKVWCPDMATRVVDRSIQIHGGIGLSRELPLEYWYRYLRTARITEGPTEVLKWRLAKNLLRSRSPKRRSSPAAD